MDKFIMPVMGEVKKDDSPTLEEAKERRKIYECAQFDCLPRHLGRAVAFKNYWVYLNDLIQA